MRPNTVMQAITTIHLNQGNVETTAETSTEHNHPSAGRHTQPGNPSTCTGSCPNATNNHRVRVASANPLKSLAETPASRFKTSNKSKQRPWKPFGTTGISRIGRSTTIHLPKWRTALGEAQ
ncbi:hypothetical protein CJF31_00008530 [Rutstroemia sp. NJR-2017a BVV2]|nr:hypothetical protein CJF31_00008530 [Rutstroemia sp. NJR-2017a BVV2]